MINRHVRYKKRSAWTLRFLWLFGSEQGAVVMPVKCRAGVGFAVGGDVAVAGNARRGDARVAGDDGAAEGGKCLVLAQGVGRMVATVQLDAYAEIVAVFPPLIAGDARVPGARNGRHILGNAAVAQDEEMGGDAQPGNGIKIGVFVPQRGQGAGKERIDVAVAMNTGRQADVVDDEQADVVRVGAVVVMRAGAAAGGI